MAFPCNIYSASASWNSINFGYFEIFGSRWSLWKMFIWNKNNLLLLFDPSYEICVLFLYHLIYHSLLIRWYKTTCKNLPQLSRGFSWGDSQVILIDDQVILRRRLTLATKSHGAKCYFSIIWKFPSTVILTFPNF